MLDAWSAPVYAIGEPDRSCLPHFRTRDAECSSQRFASDVGMSEFARLPGVTVTKCIRNSRLTARLGVHHQLMASRTIVELVDDLAGGPADESVSFGLDGREYEIDLSTANAKKLRGALEGYQAVARRIGSRPVGRPRGRVGQAATIGDAAEIREWAVSNGFEVSSRGRIPAQLREAYQAR
jgi:hypothetical protein